MKKYIIALITLVCAFMLASCGASNEDISAAIDKLDSAQTNCTSCASSILDGWSADNSIVMSAYFDESLIESNVGDVPTLKQRAEKIAEYRNAAKADVDEAKSLLKKGKGDYYETAKAYLVAANKYYNLISTYPEGYSKLTYMQAIQDVISECDSAKSEASLYTE